MADSKQQLSISCNIKSKNLPPLGCTITLGGSSKKKKEFPDNFQIDPQMIMLNATIEIKGKFAYC